MIVRHVVEAVNVDDNGFVIDAFKIKHGVIKAGKLWDLAGFIDFRTHLNLDFADHRVTECIIASRLCKHAQIKLQQEGFVFAQVKNESYKHYGFVDIDARRIEWMNRCHPKKIVQ